MDKMNKQNLEEKVGNPWNLVDMGLKVYDPFGLLGKEFPSKHCEGKKTSVIMYDYTGALYTRCECGHEYWHDHGVFF